MYLSVKGLVGTYTVAQLTFVVYFLTSHFIGSPNAVPAESECMSKLKTAFGLGSKCLT